MHSALAIVCFTCIGILNIGNGGASPKILIDVGRVQRFWNDLKTMNKNDEQFKKVDRYD
ncbi:hypothetical protein Q4Q39_10145 [Flavivirga amylovorans]|uniref:Uncharacterized protein n=1 Tax=Flavivirga amylovorans TaxID=870486 RepID=A0ABT8X2E0_9FLAO|nr:hypothetical protein [Flavivirga amylovorans]MDO5987759.1 hypothetical protein [Flavivirga amylovorans]